MNLLDYRLQNAYKVRSLMWSIFSGQTMEAGRAVSRTFRNMDQYVM